MRVTLLVAAVVASLSACGSSSSQVPVKGGDSELAKIAGDWEGEYQAPEANRTGPIKFSLGIGRHTADGTVVMGGQTPLQIRFVEVQGEADAVSGTIEPYTDPSCNCQVEAQFIGQRVGDRIEGTFTTKVMETGATQRGTWAVTRVAK